MSQKEFPRARLAIDWEGPLGLGEYIGDTGEVLDDDRELQRGE